MSSVHACISDNVSIDATLDAMLHASRYWAPDEESQWCKERVGLAKSHLYNTQRSRFDHVHYDPGMGLAITANARIDNRREIISSLALTEGDTQIATDSQLIMRAYAKWKNDCVKFLRGDFVFIIWDENRQKIFCARDHFGVKVLFYSHKPEGLMITNEHRAFFTSQWSDAHEIDEDWLIKALWSVVVPQQFDSPNPDIQVLPPAHTLEFSEEGLKITRYWQLTRKTDWQHLIDEELIDELKHRFEHAVEARLDSEYPLGSELSEGIDSNGVAGFAAKILGDKSLYTFSYDCIALDNENKHVWEETYADITEMHALHKNIKPVWQKQKSDNKYLHLQQQKSDFYSHFGGVVPLYGKGFLRSRLAQKQGIRTMLSGWGGDHCVTSYGDQYCDELFYQNRFTQLYQLLKAKNQRGRGRRPLVALAELALKNWTPTIHSQTKKARSGLDKTLRRRNKYHFLEKQWRKDKNLNKLFDEFKKNDQCKSIQRKEILELFERGLTKNLIEAELTARMAKVEYRFPMLDVALVEFAHSLPGHLKIKYGIERYAFRQILTGITTKRIQWRIKSDVSSPKINRKKELSSLSNFLAKRLNKSILVKRFSSETRMEKCLERLEPGLIRSLELLVNAEDCYYADS